MASQSSDTLDILDIDELLGDVDDENWLVATGSPSKTGSSGDSFFAADATVTMEKVALVNKLDSIARTGGSMAAVMLSPISSSSSGSRSSNLSPGVSSYLRQNLSSTPISSAKSAGNMSRFGSRTYKKPTPIHCKLSDHSMLLNNSSPLDNITDPSFFADASTPNFGSPAPANSTPLAAHINLTFDRKHSTITSPTMNVTFDKGQLNATYEKGQINQTFEKPHNATYERPQLDGTYGLAETSRNSPSPSLDETVTLVNRATASPANATFTRRKPSHEERRVSRDSSKDLHEEERVSNTSDGSVSHRLNDVGDVQLLARMQEESLRQTTNNHKSSTISPSSECSPHSPSTGCSPSGNGENFVAENHYRDHKQHQQYSSQDSLPDSPYSSQSLDSQSAQGQDRLRRSMPNLNKIRGRGGAPTNPMRKASVPVPPLGNKGYDRTNANGLSRQHTSDTRLQASRFANNRIVPPQARYGRGPPSRGSSAASEEPGQDSTGFVRPAAPSGMPKTAGMSRIARPVGSGIPRPGISRLPAPTRSGIPKPNSQPGSRASSVGPRRQ